MKRIVDYKGKKVEGTEVSFEIEHEPWCVYSLNDGSTLRIKNSLLRAIRLDGEFDPEGYPVYVTSSNQIAVAATVPDNLRKKTV